MNAYLSEILSQPQALRRTLHALDLSPLETVRRALATREIDRIVMTGMGASYNALYPAWLHLAHLGFSAFLVNASELVHQCPELIGPKTLVWAASQSGRSAEVVRLLDSFESRPPAGLLAITNEPGSPLGEAAGASETDLLRARLLLSAEPETGPSTRTYLNTLAIAQLTALVLGASSSPSQALSEAMTELDDAAGAIESYLSPVESALERIASSFSHLSLLSLDAPPPIALLGRGPSLASALTGALCLQEAAKIPALGLQAGEFRHGPIEIASSHLTVLLFAGPPGSEDDALNRKLWSDLRLMEVNTCLLSTQAADGVLPLPPAAGLGLPLAEIVPVQLLCYHLCERLGIEPGSFRHIGKVTLTE
jgi:glucosamine--fructose-6-phosphate aminotransferase (isomerizing)